MKLIKKICKKASELINSETFKERHRRNEKAFTRNRKIGFKENIALILNMLSRTLQIEIDDFVERVMQEEILVTKQAFSKARKNIGKEAFEELFELTRDVLFHKKKIKKYKGYRIFAVDGSEIMIERTHDIGEHFSRGRANISTNKCNARISLLFDVLNEFVFDASLNALTKSERDCAKSHLKKFETFCNQKDIVIFDRGYPSKEMISVLSEMDCRYLMRMQNSSFKEIAEHQESDFKIEITYQGKTYSVRVIRVELSTGETEILITNLKKSEFSKSDFLELYHFRWGVETAYNTIKNKFLIEKFSGRTVLSVYQDFFAAMFLFNCVSAISFTLNRKFTRLKRNCRYHYRANHNLIVACLKFRLPAILLGKYTSFSETCKKLLLLCMRQPIPVKPYRSFQRPLCSHQRKVTSPKYPI